MRDNELTSDARDETSDSTYWYIWTETRQIGPIFFSRLRQMAHQGKLGVDDKVRRGTTGEWVRAGSLQDILFPSILETESTAAQCEQAVSETQPSVRQAGILANLISSIQDRFEVFFEGIKYAFVDRLSSIRVIASWIALTAVAIASIVVALEHFPVGWLTTIDPIATYTSIWDELKEKRTAKASAAEWDAFAAKARLDVAPIVRHLERTAGVNDRVSQQLLWAGRDYLPQMLDDARTDESRSETKFAEHLRRANWMKQGRDINGNMRRRNASPASSLFLTDNTTTVLGIAFLIVDVGFVVWFLKGRRKTGSPA